ncbi:MAG: hypothetical protein V3W34_13760 [Phycisphaerae bacterium]
MAGSSRTKARRHEGRGRDEGTEEAQMCDPGMGNRQSSIPNRQSSAVPR